MFEDFILDNIDGQDILYGNEGEIWKKIPSFPWYYINEYGDVISIRKGIMHKLSPWTNQYGHKYVELHDGDRHQKVLIHRLVAKLYLHGSGPVVRHLDDDPNNNHYSNLAYGTQKDNCNDMKERNRMFTKPVYCIETGKIYKSCAEAAKDFGVSRAAITHNCNGKLHAIHNKYHLNYIKEDTYARSN